jgi:demethylmenaquinone methyltransferase/2-methoxy-6-polyprenyl-1,4-benzoquinol methylase
MLRGVTFHARSDAGIYQPGYVKSLFDEMAATYGVVNVLSSFGFCILWRKRCVRHVGTWPASGRVLDLMSGMGELWNDLLRRTDAGTSVTGVDISPVMCSRAREHSHRTGRAIDVVEADVLADDLPDASADVVVSSFGLKTFSPDQQGQLAATIHRVLKPGGRFAMLEISVPSAVALRWPYLLYLRHVIPVVGRLFLGNPDCYRMLSVYTEAFHDASHFATACREQGLAVQFRRHFFGCASAVSGTKPL